MSGVAREGLRKSYSSYPVSLLQFCIKEWLLRCHFPQKRESNPCVVYFNNVLAILPLLGHFSLCTEPILQTKEREISMYKFDRHFQMYFNCNYPGTLTNLWVSSVVMFCQACTVVIFSPCLFLEIICLQSCLK